MKDLIKQALADAFILFEKRIPQTKILVKHVSIGDVKPLDIATFMKDNNIPDNACFSTSEDDANYSYPYASLCYDIDIPTTDKDKLKFKREKFTQVAWKFVYDLLLKNGYKRVGFNSGLLRQFDGTTVYDMYINESYDMLVRYYSLPFILIDTNN